MIYILEDDDSIRKLVTYALESQGYAATGFAVPSAFYKAMKERVPSLLLLDIMLPAHGASAGNHADSQKHRVRSCGGTGCRRG